MKNNLYLPSADTSSAVIKSEIYYIKVTIVIFIEQRNLRSLALHFYKALQEPCRNSFLLMRINRRDITNRTGCTQMYRYTFSEEGTSYVILTTRNRTQVNLKSHPVKSSPLRWDIMMQFC